MIKIAICDDEKVIADQIEQYILQISERENIPVDTDVFYNGKSLEQEVYKGTRYDLIYMDIQMKNGDGIATAKNIREIDVNALLVYVSGYGKHALELFRWDVFEFILKPIDKQKFETCFFNAFRKISSLRLYFSYQYKKQEFKLLSMDILYFESKGRKILIHTNEGDTREFNGKLSDVEEWALKGKVPFLRIHQSYLVNYHHIISRSKEEMRLKDGTRLHISEDRQKYIARCYDRLLRSETDV